MPARLVVVFILCVLCLCFMNTGCTREAKSEDKIDITSLLRNLVDVDAFARNPGGSARLISTYDQNGGNNDGAFWALTGGIDSDGVCVVADIKGPGCVTRIWQTSVPADKWLFYFDGEENPRIEVTDTELFGESDRFPKPLCGNVSEGRYCYMPIPFKKSLKIVVLAPRLRSTSRSYCHVNYISYRAGTLVESAPSELTEDTKELLQRVCESWVRNSDWAKRIIDDKSKETVKIDLPQAKTVRWLDKKGAGVLGMFCFKIGGIDALTVSEKTRLLRSLVLRIYWDGSVFPSVDVPLGDFFCNASEYRSYSSLPLAYLDGVYMCRFPMPFMSAVRAELRNDGEIPVALEVSYTIDSSSETQDQNYFHARWNSAMSTGAPYDLLSAGGQGHYVGCYLNVIGVDWFILEGDESIAVDDGRITMYGTGLEDYFNGAWYYTRIFDLPLHGLLEKAPFRTSQYRFHMLDSINFDKNIKVQFEFGHANKSRGYMSSVAYWYQAHPKPVWSQMSDIKRRYVPLDPAHHDGFMSHLFELERIGHFAEARERCHKYIERFPSSPAVGVIGLRAAAYTEILDGFNGAKNKYESVALARKDDRFLSRQQAKDLTWFHRDRRNVLLAAHANSDFKLYLDGQLVFSGKSLGGLQVARSVLDDGKHELTAEVTSVNPDPWFSVCLRTHETNITTDASWEYVRQRPSSWPITTVDPSVKWSKVWDVLRNLPRIGAWRFTPNAFVNMQSGSQLMRPWDAWGSQGRETLYVRKRFVLRNKIK